MPLTSLNESSLDDLLGKLESARAWSPRVISRLEAFIRAADDYALFRINPIRYATERGMAENEAIDLFLHGVKSGLFEMEWHLVCASCGHVVENLRSMNQLHAHFKCNLCSYENAATLDDYIQVAFTIAPPIRAIAFHHPEGLPAEDFCLKYHLCQGIQPPPGIARYEDLVRAASQVMAFLEPGEVRRVEFDVESGIVLGIDLIHDTTFVFLVGPTPAPAPQTVSAQLVDGQFHVATHDLRPQQVAIRGSSFAFDHYSELLTGRLRLEVENRTDRRSSLWVTHFRGEPPPVGLTFEPFLSGKRLLTTQTFRNLFRSEVVSADEGIGVKDLTFLFTDLKGSTALYDEIGDPKAYFLVRQHFDTLGNVISHYEGATVKTIGDAVMATFMTPLDAVNAALEMLRDIKAFNRNITNPLVLKIGIHKGHSIVVTLNDRLDYFGQTVNIAARVQGLADANEIYVSADVYSFPGVQEAVSDCGIVPEQAIVKGVSEKLQVYKITPHS